MKSFALTLILIAAAGGAHAAMPGLMSYQGRIKESGLPVTGTRAVDIQICPTPASAPGCVITGAQNVSVANGLFRTTFTLPSAVAWETGEWYLQVSVGGTAFMPRERLAAVPYAIYASSAATLIPNPGDTAVFVASNVVIADSGFSVGGSTLVVAGGRVGVNVAAPASELEVSGTLTLSGAAHVRGTGAGAPAIANGTGPNCTSSTILGSDLAGRITAGAAGSAGTCTLVFATPWTGNPPVCFFQDETTAVSMRASAPTVFGVTYGGSFNLGDVLSYICVGY